MVCWIFVLGGRWIVVQTSKSRWVILWDHTLLDGDQKQRRRLRAWLAFVTDGVRLGGKRFAWRAVASEQGKSHSMGRHGWMGDGGAWAMVVASHGVGRAGKSVIFRLC